jgi:hypothetical protein
MSEIPSQARTAILKTIEAVPGYFLTRFQTNGRILTDRTRDRLLTKESEGECRNASAHSIYKLAQQPQLFKYLALIRAVRNPMDSTSHFNNPAFESHSYFVARDYQSPGVWYAASPANFRPGEADPFSSILESADLSDIVGSIEQSDGGIWPTAERITKLLEVEYNPPVLLGPDHIGVTEIQGRDLRSRYSRVTLSSYYPR